MLSTLVLLAIGVAAGLISAWIIAAFGRARVSTVAPSRRNLRLLLRLQRANITNMRFSQKEHTEKFLDLITTAQRSLELIGFSYRSTDMAHLCETLQKLFRERPQLTVHVSLIDPDCPEVNYLSRTYEIPEQQIKDDVRLALRMLLKMKDHLSESAAERFAISIHRNPMGTANLIDCSGDVSKESLIQTEFKLYKIHRAYAFGYDVRHGGNEVFANNLVAWRSILDEAEMLTNSHARSVASVDLTDTGELSHRRD